MQTASEPGIRVVAVFRPPWDVVSSLSRIYKIFRENEALAVETWILFNQKILDYKKKNAHRCLLVNSSRVLDNPKLLAVLAEEKLGLFGLSKSIDEEGLRTVVVQPDLYTKMPQGHELADSWRKNYPSALSTFNELEAISDL